MTRTFRTLRDLAAALDVSVATVSRALAGDERIAEATRERVRGAARRHGYVPNRAAKALVSGRSGFVALAVPGRGPGKVDPFLGEFVSGLAEGLGARGLDLLLTAPAAGKPEVEVLRGLVASRQADGIVLARTREADERVAFLAGRGLPFVSHGRAGGIEAPFDWVDTDGARAFGEAFDLLYGLGHRRFGLVTIAEPMSFRRDREAGLAAAIGRRGDPAVTLDVAAAPRFDDAARAAAIARLLGRAPMPTAVLALFDGLALDVMVEAARRGLSVPADLSVIGFDDVPAAAHARPGLTTFDAAIHACARELADVLAGAIAEPGRPARTHLLAAPLVRRGSHGPAPGGPGA